MPSTLLIDAVSLTSPGAQQLQTELTRMVAARRPSGWRIVLARAKDGPSPEVGDGIEIMQVDRGYGWIGLWDWSRRGIVKVIRRQSIDVVYAMGGLLSPSLSNLCGTINSVNNMIPFTPEQMAHFPLFSKGRARMLLLRAAYTSGCRAAHAVVVHSKHVIDRLAAYGADVASKSYVAYSSVPEYVRYRPAQPPPYDGRPYIFYLSGVLWYKNHLNLIEGYRRAVAGGADLPDLLFAGRSEEPVYVSRINAAIEQGHLTGRVRYLGFIPRESIPGYLHHATINAFASTCETNSFAETEILGAHGVLACSNCPPMPEIAAGAAELFDPFDPDSIAATLVKLYRDRELREQLRERAARRAGELTPERQGEVVWAAIHHARQAFRTNGARRTGVT